MGPVKVQMLRQKPYDKNTQCAVVSKKEHGDVIGEEDWLDMIKWEEEKVLLDRYANSDSSNQDSTLQELNAFYRKHGMAEIFL